MSRPNASPISYRRTNVRSYSENTVSPYGPLSSPGKPIQSISLTMKQTPEKNTNWLGSLNSHSHFVTTRSNRVNLVCSLLYLLFNVIHHYSNEHFHSITFVWLSDCALSTLNGLMLVAAACYWVSYVERVKFDSEVLRIRNQLAYNQSINPSISAQVSPPAADKLEGGFAEDNLVDFVDPTESENLIQQQLHADHHLPHTHSHVTPSPPGKHRVYTAFVVYFLSFIPRQFGVSYSHMLQTMHVSLIVSPRLYILSLLGVAEFLNMFGSLFYYISSFFPVIASTQQMVLGGMRESVEAKLDEISYILDAIAMIAFVLSAILYFFTWKRHFPVRQSALSASLFGFLYDPEFWANVWNSAGGVCYALSILYGLAIRAQLAQQEQDTWDYIQEGNTLEDQSIDASTDQLVFDSMSSNISDVMLNYTQSIVNLTMSHSDSLPVDVFAEAESTVGLSAWQTALFGLTLEQKGMMVLGDVMYAICALVTQLADPSSSMRGGASRSRRTSGRVQSHNRKNNDENSNSQANVEQVPLMHPSEDIAPHSVQAHRAGLVESVT